MEIEAVEQNIKDGVYTLKPPKKSNRKRASPIWNYVYQLWNGDELLKSYVVCSKCNKIMKYDSALLGTKHILNHVKTHEEAEINENNTMESFVLKTKKNRNVGETHKKVIQNACVNFLTKDLRSYAAVQGEGLVNLLRTFTMLGAIYGNLDTSDIFSIIPSGQTISRLVTKNASVLKDKLKADLKLVILKRNMIAMTLDIWQDQFKRISYLGITAHYFEVTNTNVHLCDKIICMKPMESGVAKDSTVVRSAIREKLVELEIDDFFNKIIFVSDRGGNIKKALVDVKRLNCFVHFLNNIVKKSCQIDVVKNIIDSCKSLVRYFKINGLNNLLPTALKSACDTRFNYIYLTLNSILKNYDQVEDVLRGRNEIKRMEFINYAELDAISKYLKEFKTWTEISSASKKPTLYTVWIGIHSIMEHSFIDDEDHSLVAIMKVKAFTYIEEHFVLSPTHRMATFLHPSYKSLKFASPEFARNTHHDIQKEIDQMSGVDSNQRRYSSSSESSSTSVLSQYLDYTGESDELQDYIHYKIACDSELDIMSWWKSKENEFPRLSQIAFRIHSIPASSIPSERSFSKCGSIINEKRSSLSPDSIEDLIVLHQQTIETRKNRLSSSILSNKTINKFLLNCS